RGRDAGRGKGELEEGEEGVRTARYPRALAQGSPFGCELRQQIHRQFARGRHAGRSLPEAVVHSSRDFPSNGGGLARSAATSSRRLVAAGRRGVSRRRASRSTRRRRLLLLEG